jgi:hypothetical protein
MRAPAQRDVSACGRPIGSKELAGVMSQVEHVAAVSETSAAHVRSTRRLTATLSSPVAVFIALSLLFGAATVALTPPLRGADEPAHFLRAYAVLTGEIVPSTFDDRGRKGVFLPAELHRQMDVYEIALGGIYRNGAERWSFREVLAERDRLGGRRGAESDAPVFVPYGGSEGYSPAPYLPFLPGLALARLIDLDFLSTVYLMRATGLVTLTALVAAAIALVPYLRWAFLLIALLPSALFSRAMLSADGSSLAYTMLVVALCLRGACGLSAGGAWVRSLSMLLCVLAKPPQIVFVLAEAMRGRQWLSGVALVVMPAIVLTLVWAAVSSGDAASWRILEGSNNAPEHFQPLWKLRFLLEHPLHFPTLLLGTAHYIGAYGLQLIGILGWLDMRLQEWVYPVLGAGLLFGLYAPLQIDARTRRRLTIVSALAVIGYCLAVFMIFYLVWTPIDGVQIEGVQGRYFVVALPFAAVTLSSLIDRAPPASMTRAVAVFAAVLSGMATIEAILRADWRFALLP